jgi:DNA-binding SARP family transcriptional activator
VLLAVLLWQANQPVPADELAELVWDGAPPARTADALRSLVMRLRRQLDPRAAARIVTRAPGYLIEVSIEELDASRFEVLTSQAGAAVLAGQWEQARRSASAALGLWRGTPLADVPSQLLRDRWTPRLDQLHEQALDWRIEADLQGGRHEQLLTELRDLTVRRPLRERFHSQLMLALYRCGHRAEALVAYQRARDVLVAELGIEPGPGLRELHQQILRANPALTVTGPAPACPGAGMPRELPAAVPGFTGRAAELQALSRLLDRPGGQPPGTVMISAISGTAGVGKTALAVHWAHQVAGRFSDGQLYVNLRGYDPDPPMTAADALARFLRSLGVPGPGIPQDLEDRAAQYRSLVAGRRMLIVLDNVGSTEQVRPLLPGTSSCLTVVTSRDSLAGLVAREGAVRLDLDLLPGSEAVSLLQDLIGERATADPAATRELAAQCSRLPLALRVAAEFAAARPATPLASLITELTGQQQRLDLLDAAGDRRTAVRAVFSWSVRSLDPATARTFRLLGLHPGIDLDLDATAALTASTTTQAERALQALTRGCLTRPTAPGRYTMHELLRAYARDLSASTDTRADRNAALTRLFNHYLHTAAIHTQARLAARHIDKRAAGDARCTRSFLWCWLRKVHSGARTWQQVDVGCVHWLAAVGAVQLGMADVTARVVAVQHWGTGLAREPFVSPGGHDHEHVDQVGPHGGQVVLEARPLVVRTAAEHALADKMVQSLGQDLARDPEIGLYLVEPGEPDPYVTQDQRRPGLPDDVESTRDRAGHLAEVGALHGTSLAITVPLGNLSCYGVEVS